MGGGQDKCRVTELIQKWGGGGGGWKANWDISGKTMEIRQSQRKYSLILTEPGSDSQHGAHSYEEDCRPCRKAGYVFVTESVRRSLQKKMHLDCT